MNLVSDLHTIRGSKLNIHLGVSLGMTEAEKKKARSKARKAELKALQDKENGKHDRYWLMKQGIYICIFSQRRSNCYCCCKWYQETRFQEIV